MFSHHWAGQEKTCPLAGNYFEKTLYVIICIAIDDGKEMEAHKLKVNDQDNTQVDGGDGDSMVRIMQMR